LEASPTGARTPREGKEMKKASRVGRVKVTKKRKQKGTSVLDYVGSSKKITQKKSPGVREGKSRGGRRSNKKGRRKTRKTTQ